MLGKGKEKAGVGRRTGEPTGQLSLNGGGDANANADADANANANSNANANAFSFPEMRKRKETERNIIFRDQRVNERFIQQGPGQTTPGTNVTSGRHQTARWQGSPGNA